MIDKNKIDQTKNPYLPHIEHLADSPELDEGDLHNAWNEGYSAGIIDSVIKAVSSKLDEEEDE